MKRPMNKGLKFAVFCVILFYLIFSMSSCKTIEKTAYIERVDTCYINKVERDSIYLKDSVFVREKGDTVFYDRWHTEYVYKMKCDTVVKYIDNIVKEQVEVQKVEFKTPWYSKLLIWFFLIISVLLAIYVVYLKIFR